MVVSLSSQFIAYIRCWQKGSGFKKRGKGKYQRHGIQKTSVISWSQGPPSHPSRDIDFNGIVHSNCSNSMVKRVEPHHTSPMQLAAALWAEPLRCVWSLGMRTQYLPPSPLSMLGWAHSMYREPERMWFHCLGWQPLPNLSASSRTACRIVGGKKSIIVQAFEKSPGWLLW